MSFDQSIESIFSEIHSLDIKRDVAANDRMMDGDERHYFGVGRSATYVITGAIVARHLHPGGNAPITSILDYGCGYGRVARYLRAMFPRARIAGTDFIAEGVEWCVNHFGYDSITGRIPQHTFDLIWVGSVFTHLPEDVVRSIIMELKDALRPGGVLIFTTQGRHAARMVSDTLSQKAPRYPWSTYFLEDEAATRLLHAYEQGHYAFVDYPGKNGYGVAIAPLTWFLNPDLVGPGHTVLSVQERAWDSHQDVVAYMRLDISAPGKGAFY